MSQTHEIPCTQPGNASASAADAPPPTLTSDLLDILLVHMIRRAGIDAASSAPNTRLHPSNAYSTSRFRRDPAHTGRRVHTILCATPASAAMPLVRRAALTAVWWYNMDLASRDGRIDLLNELVTMRRAHGAPLDFSPAAIDLSAQMGHVDVLKWWLNESKVPLGASLHALDLASEAGRLDVLDWFASMAKDGKVVVRVQWSDRNECYSGPSWSRPGQLVLYSPDLRGLKHAIEHSTMRVLKWWLPVFLDRFQKGYPPDVIEWIGTAGLQVVEWWHSQDPTLPLAHVFSQAALHGRLDTIRWIMDRTQAVLSDVDVHMAFIYAASGSARLKLQVMQLIFPLVAPALLDRFSLIDLLCSHPYHQLAEPVQLFTWCFESLPPKTLPSCEQMLIFATLHGHVDLLDWIVANHDPGSRKLLSMIALETRYRGVSIPAAVGGSHCVGSDSFRLGNALARAFHAGYVAVVDWWIGYLDRPQTIQQLLELNITLNRQGVRDWAWVNLVGAIPHALDNSNLPLLDCLIHQFGKRSKCMINIAFGATTACVLDWWQSTVADEDLSLPKDLLRTIVQSAVSKLNVEVLDWWCRKWKDGSLDMPALYDMDELFTIALADWPMLRWYLSMGYPVFPEVGFPSTLVDEGIATGDWQGLEWWYHELHRLDLLPPDAGLGFSFADRANSVPGLKWCRERLPMQRLDEEAIWRAYLMAWRNMQTGLIWYWMERAPDMCGKAHVAVERDGKTAERGVFEMWEYPQLPLTVHRHETLAQCPRYPCQCVLSIRNTPPM